MELPSALSGLSLPIFFLKKFLILKKKFLLYFEKVLFRTMANLEPEAYSEHCQTSTMECFTKKFLYFWEMELYGSSIKKFILFFLKRNISLYFRKRNIFIFHKKKTLKNTPYIFSKESFFYIRETETLKNFLYCRK